MALQKLAAEEKALSEANESLAAQIEAQSMGKEDSEERRGGLVEMNKLEEIVKELDSELKRHQDNDPEVIKKLKIEYTQAKDDCNRWTGMPCHAFMPLDNLFALQSYCCTNFGISRPDFLAQFGLEEDVDYVE
jgi:PHP family Zn ribbon phosphoesterase